MTRNSMVFPRADVLKLAALRHEQPGLARGCFYARVEWWPAGQNVVSMASDLGHTPMQAARAAWRSARRAQLKAVTKALTL